MYELPRPIQSTSLRSPHHEYPSAAFLTPTTVFVSDGYGSMYILHLTDTGSSQLLGIFELPTTTINSPPFRIHDVVNVSPTMAVALLSSGHYEEISDEAPSASKGRTKSSPAEFDIWAARFDSQVLGSSTDIRKTDILWHRRGKDVPISLSYNDSWKSYILIGGSVYREIGPAPLSYEPSPDELVPIPRQNENLDTKESLPHKPPPYAWTQTTDSVTVAFPLPSTTLKSNIKVLFSPRTVTLHIQGESPTPTPFPNYSAKTLWDDISPSSSFWTWDREAEHSFGLLTLHLDKQHEGTKWMHIFASAGSSTTSESNPEDVEVPETLDPSELWHIREALEKYTTALCEGDDASGLGLGRGVPSLAEGELDDEVDSSVGRTTYLTWVGGDGSVPPWSTQAQEIPFTLLSTPFPGGGSEASLIVKNNLDGLVFSLNAATPSPESVPVWNHTSTFSALAFVLASKQDTRFTHHMASKAVFAFENGVRDRGGNVYIYRAVPTSEKWAKQTILKIGAGQAGCLLGVGEVKTGEGMPVILCLTDGELVLIKSIL